MTEDNKTKVAETSGVKVYTLADCEGHKSRDSCWVAIHGRVYDVAKFLDEHPGGDDVILAEAGETEVRDVECISAAALAWP